MLAYKNPLASHSDHPGRSSVALGATDPDLFAVFKFVDISSSPPQWQGCRRVVMHDVLYGKIRRRPYEDFLHYSQPFVLPNYFLADRQA